MSDLSNFIRKFHHSAKNKNDTEVKDGFELCESNIDSFCGSLKNEIVMNGDCGLKDCSLKSCNLNGGLNSNLSSSLNGNKSVERNLKNLSSNSVKNLSSMRENMKKNIKSLGELNMNSINTNDSKLKDGFENCRDGDSFEDVDHDSYCDESYDSTKNMILHCGNNAGQSFKKNFGDSYGNAYGNNFRESVAVRSVAKNMGRSVEQNAGESVMQKKILNEINDENFVNDSFINEGGQDMQSEIFNIQKKVRSIEAQMKRSSSMSAEALNKNGLNNVLNNGVKKGITSFIKTGKLGNGNEYYEKSLKLSESKQNTLVVNDKVTEMIFSSEKYAPLSNCTNHIFTRGICNIVVNRPNVNDNYYLNTVQVNNVNDYDSHQKLHKVIGIKQYHMLDTIIVHDDMRQAHNVDDILYSQLISRITASQNRFMLLGRGDDNNEPNGILTFPNHGNPNKDDFAAIKEIESTMEEMMQNPTDKIVELYSQLSSGYVDEDTKICMSYTTLNILRRYRQQNAGHSFGIVSERRNENNNYVFSVLGHEVVIINELSHEDNHKIIFMNGKEFYTSTSSDIELFIDDSMNRPFRTIGIQTAIGGAVTNPNAAVILNVKGRFEGNSKLSSNQISKKQFEESDV